MHFTNLIYEHRQPLRQIREDGRRNHLECQLGDRCWVMLMAVCARAMLVIVVRFPIGQVITTFLGNIRAGTVRLHAVAVIRQPQCEQ